MLIDTPEVDLRFSKLVQWALTNLSDRERMLIYVFENFQRAYITKRELNANRHVSPYDELQCKIVQRYLEQLQISITLD